MAKQKNTRSAKQPVVIKLRKSHRIATFILYAFFFFALLLATVFLAPPAAFGWGMSLLLFAMAAIPLLPLPLYFGTWQITFDSKGIHKKLFWIKGKSHTWAQVKEVRSALLISEKNTVVSILFKDGKAIRFRMDCENAEKARTHILSHCSIKDNW